MILIYSDSTDSKVTVSAPVWNEPYPPRRYQFTGHFLELDGPGHIVAFDAEDICKIPGNRLATASEQNQWTASKRKAAQLVEAAPAAEEVAPSSAESPEESAKAAAPKSAAKG